MATIEQNRQLAKSLLVRSGMHYASDTKILPIGRLCLNFHTLLSKTLTNKLFQKHSLEISGEAYRYLITKGAFCQTLRRVTIFLHRLKFR